MNYNWISCKDRFPQLDEEYRSEYVLATDGKHIWIAYYLDYQYYDQYIFNGLWKDSDSYTIKNVTHWAILPDLPLSDT